MSYKIIFLDIDGVLNNDSCVIRIITENGNNILKFTFSTNVLDNLRKIIDKTNAYIVISSHWRLTEKRFNHWQKTGESSDNLWNNLIENFRPYGLVDKIIGVTPRLLYPSLKSVERGTEIEKWIENNSDLSIESMVILDDDNDMSPYSSHLILCNSGEGLTEEIATCAIKMLLEPFKRETKIREISFIKKLDY